MSVGLSLLLLTACSAAGDEPAQRPNILVIIADDLGYTDLGVYGGEIGTPNLDELANEGILFTNFHTASTCSPTRAMLLSGTDNHLVGLGAMWDSQADNQLHQPGHEGYLNFRVATLPELLRDAGYHTYMTGKWHLGLDDETGPAARGFEKSFALLPGGGGHFDDLAMFASGHPAPYREDGEPVTLPEDFYSTRFYAEKMIEYIGHGRKDDRPFFAYLAFTAPHWPLQAPDASIARYAGRYDMGYDRLHAERLHRLRSLDHISENVEAHAPPPDMPAWESLSDDNQRTSARKMEVYAAMVNDLDDYIGRVIEHLKEIGEYENTLILFMSDNGAEGHEPHTIWDSLSPWIAECCDNSYENIGKPNSYVYYGPGWARASIGPFRMYKGSATEGGIRAPAFVSYPGFGSEARIHRGFVSVMDIMPTLLELAGTSHPGARYDGRYVLPMKGRSMLPMLLGEAEAVHEPDAFMGWELFGKRAVREGDWKLVWTPEPYGPSDWQLYDLGVDPSEIHDLSERFPDRRSELLARWDRYVKENGVILPEKTSGY